MSNPKDYCSSCSTTEFPGIFFPGDSSDREPSRDGKVFVQRCDTCWSEKEEMGYASDVDAAEAIASVTGWTVLKSYDHEDAVDPKEREEKKGTRHFRPYFAVTLADAQKLMQGKMPKLRVRREIDLSKNTALKNLFGPLEKLEWLEDEDCLHGCLYICGVPHHVTCVRVQLVCCEHNKVGEICGGQWHQGTRDPHSRLEDILAGDFDGGPQTVELPGFEGEWVIGVDPYRD